MRQFFKFMFASMLGFFLSLIVLVFIIGAFTAAFISSATSKQEQHTGPNTVLHIKFTSELADRRSDDPFSSVSFSDLKPNIQPGLIEMTEAIKKAKDDANINGIYLDVSGFSAGYASARELRDALLDFKKSGKFILAYGDNYSQGGYYLASAASQVWLNPEGFVELKGLNSTTPFLKGLLSKLDIEPQVIRHGKYKSAVEPFILDKMSDESREQISVFVDRFWGLFTEEVAAARKISAEKVNDIADSLLIRSSEDALALKIVDKVGYFDQFLAELSELNGSDTKQTPDFISLSKYVNVPETGTQKPFTRDRIAVIYAAGDIVPGEGSSDEIGGSSLAKLIRDARKDDKVKAVVLRVNSPGGDALASDVVWREVNLCRDKKPFVVSMGDVAASGGYYISCAADTIVAQPTTITGSIGVFGLMFNLGNMLNNKVGVTFDGYKTSPYSDMGSMFRPLTEQERNIISTWVDDVYNTFTGKVAEGRGMSQAEVDSVGQGRVWAGVDAKNAGLVDVLGGLNTAVEIAAKMARVDNYRIKEMPELKDPFVKLLEDVSGEAETRWMKSVMGDQYDTYRLVDRLSNYNGVQARSLFAVTLD